MYACIKIKYGEEAGEAKCEASSIVCTYFIINPEVTKGFSPRPRTKEQGYPKQAISHNTDAPTQLLDVTYMFMYSRVCL